VVGTWHHEVHVAFGNRLAFGLHLLYVKVILSSGVYQFFFAEGAIKKKLQAYKPDSVRAPEGTRDCHLSGQFVTKLFFTAYPSRSAAPGGTCTIEQIAPRERPLMYVAFQSTRFVRMAICMTIPCALTTHFHPYFVTKAVLFCDTFWLSLARYPSR
jgi:hypothetical protein